MGTEKSVKQIGVSLSVQNNFIFLFSNDWLHFVTVDVHQPQWRELCEDGSAHSALGWADGGSSQSWARSTTPSNSISRFTWCSELNLHENQIHKFSHGFDQEFCGCYCSFWIIVKVMADGNVFGTVCQYSSLFFSQQCMVKENYSYLHRGRWLSLSFG